ncbi:hypothetical protein N7468_002775 [Penicillium chermesinum]|uniref:Uncharacterized protein n=1 Tax=Penicillium chermesinum TaxID=63820 RepID=A0A9W9TYB1_9EURO|nr:uncharacterized protein N7468_002775 [Penicillium chermesinum]KAJ5247792.1 hypothetical protein N7468_002775 [Penicillium chermesinum]
MILRELRVSPKEHFLQQINSEASDDSPDSRRASKNYVTRDWTAFAAAPQSPTISITHFTRPKGGPPKDVFLGYSTKDYSWPPDQGGARPGFPVSDRFSPSVHDPSQKTLSERSKTKLFPPIYMLNTWNVFVVDKSERALFEESDDYTYKEEQTKKLSLSAGHYAALDHIPVKQEHSSYTESIMGVLALAIQKTYEFDAEGPTGYLSLLSYRIDIYIHRYCWTERRNKIIEEFSMQVQGGTIDVSDTGEIVAALLLLFAAEEPSPFHHHYP